MRDTAIRNDSHNNNNKNNETNRNETKETWLAQNEMSNTVLCCTRLVCISSENIGIKFTIYGKVKMHWKMKRKTILRNTKGGGQLIFVGGGG